MKNRLLSFLLLVVFYLLANSTSQRNKLFLERHPPIKLSYSNHFRDRQTNQNNSSSDNPDQTNNNNYPVSSGNQSDDYLDSLLNDSGQFGNSDSQDTTDSQNSDDSSPSQSQDQQNNQSDSSQHDTSKISNVDILTLKPLLRTYVQNTSSKSNLEESIMKKGSVNQSMTNNDSLSANFTRAIRGHSSDKGLGFEMPNIPTTFNSVSNSFLKTVDTIENLPVVNQLFGKKGYFSDTPADPATVDNENQVLNGENDFITLNDKNVLPDNIDQLLQINLGDQTILEKSYISISADLKVYQNTYIDCLHNLSDLDFTQANIELCVGKDQHFVDDDISFFKRKVLSKSDSILQSRFFENCYKPAGVDLVLSSGCDLLQKDVMKLLWDEMNYYSLIDYHRNKYMFLHANLPDNMVEEMVLELKYLYQQQNSLFVELYNHSILTHQRIKDFIADRNLDIEEELEMNGPLERAPLSPEHIIKVDPTKVGLQKINELRQNSPWVMGKVQRQMKEDNSEHDFKTPWGKGQEASYGRAEFQSISKVRNRVIETINKKIELL